MNWSLPGSHGSLDCLSADALERALRNRTLWTTLLSRRHYWRPISCPVGIRPYYVRKRREADTDRLHCERLTVLTPLTSLHRPRADHSAARPPAIVLPACTVKLI